VVVVEDKTVVVVDDRLGPGYSSKKSLPLIAKATVYMVRSTLDSRFDPF
jgi:hypothetical protein